MNFSASTAARTAIFAGLVLAVTLPLKLAPRPAQDSYAADLAGKTAALRIFLAGHPVGAISTMQANPYDKDWFALSFDMGSCRATVLADPRAQDGEALVARSVGRNKRLVHIYRGAISASYPRLPIAFDRIAMRLLSVVRPQRQRLPLVVILLTSGDCAAVLQWDWKSLWRDRKS